jgi:hypothetical protein
VTTPQRTTWIPSSKLAAAGGGFGFAIVASWILSTYLRTDVPEEVWVALGGGITWLSGYFKREKRQGVTPEPGSDYERRMGRP